MLGRQLVNLLLKGGFWPHEGVESPSLNHENHHDLHHPGQFYLLALLLPYVCLQERAGDVSQFHTS